MMVVDPVNLDTEVLMHTLEHDIGFNKEARVSAAQQFAAGQACLVFSGALDKCVAVQHKVRHRLRIVWGTCTS